MSKSNPEVTPILAASIVSRPRATTWHIRFWPLDMPPWWPATLNEKARHKRRAFPLCGVRFGRLGGFRFLVDGAFGDLGQGRIGLLFFSESLIQKPDRTAQSELVGPGFECAVA